MSSRNMNRRNRNQRDITINSTKKSEISRKGWNFRIVRIIDAHNQLIFSFSYIRSNIKTEESISSDMFTNPMAINKKFSTLICPLKEKIQRSAQHNTIHLYILTIPSCTTIKTWKIIDTIFCIPSMWN